MLTMNETERINAMVKAAIDSVMGPLSSIVDPNHHRTSDPAKKDPSRSEPAKKDPASKAEWIFREKLAEEMPSIVGGFGRFLARNNYDRKDFESFLQDLIKKEGFMTKGGKISDVKKYVNEHRFEIMHDYFVRDDNNDDNAGDPGKHDTDDPTGSGKGSGTGSIQTDNHKTYQNMNEEEIKNLVADAVAKAMAPFSEAIKKITDQTDGRDPGDPNDQGDAGTGAGTGSGDDGTGNDGDKKKTHEEWLEERMHRAVDKFTGKGDDDGNDDTFDPTANLDTTSAVDAWMKSKESLKGKDI